MRHQYRVFGTTRSAKEAYKDVFLVGRAYRKDVPSPLNILSHYAPEIVPSPYGKGGPWYQNLFRMNKVFWLSANSIISKKTLYAYKTEPQSLACNLSTLSDVLVTVSRVS